jgi:type I restriction enzyme S subunit
MADSSLVDNVEIVMGQSPPGETCNMEGRGFPLLNGPTEYGAHHPTPVQFTTDARKRAQVGDVLFCVRGSTTGRMNWADREYAIGRGVAAIRHKKNLALQPFVRAVVEYNLPGLLAQATGSTFPNVSADQLAGLWWPPIEEHEQRAIAHILGTLDDKIELNRRMNETLEAMARALFKSWFVDFDPVRAKAGGRDPGLPQPLADLFPDSFEDSELGEIPRGWEVGRFKDTVEHLREQESPLSSPAALFHHFSIPAFDEGQIPKRDYGESIKSLKSRVPAGTILLSKLNPEIERVWMVDVRLGEHGVCSTEFLVLRPMPPFARSYVYCLARSPMFRQQVEGLVTGTSKSHQRAQVDSVLNLPVVMPPSPLVGAFERCAAGLLARTLDCRRGARILAALRDTLLPKLISGDLRVPDSESLVQRAVP